jgi:hypothetical protein
VIAVIAGIARDRESKTSPRVNSDDTDQESLRWSGMRSRNLFVFLIEAWGKGGVGFADLGPSFAAKAAALSG